MVLSPHRNIFGTLWPRAKVTGQVATNKAWFSNNFPLPWILVGVKDISPVGEYAIKWDKVS